MHMEDNCKKITYEGIIYFINEEKNTASVVGYQYFNSPWPKVIIPRAINYKSKEYVVKNILKKSFLHLKSINTVGFVSDSEVQIIEEDAFLYSSIKGISLPSSLIKLKNGWCHCTQYLTTIEIEPNNPCYSCYNKKFIIGKSTSNFHENFDVLVFCVRNIEEANIPKYIKYIEPYAFEICSKLNKINFQENSELQIIGKFSFCLTQIQSISLPPSVTKICEYAFYSCKKLRRIEIPTNSQLRTIEKYAFTYSPIKSIFVPASLIDLKDKWCDCLYKLRKIEVDRNNPRYLSWEDAIVIGKSTENQKNYDVFVFAIDVIEKIKIPKCIKIIGSHSFICCKRLQQIEFPTDSKVRIIEKEAFANLNIKSISIPSHLTKICEGAFDGCTSLHQFEIPINSELRTIEKNAFINSAIESLFIPASLIDLKECWCNCTSFLKKIEVDHMNPRYSCCDNNKFIIGKSNENQENYDVLVFCVRDIVEVMIPDFIKVIGSCAFDNCRLLKKIKFTKNSKLKIIENKAFSFTAIENISIPSHVTKICENAFSDCQKLRRIKFPINSELQIIEKEAFARTAIESISIPIHVTEICDRIFFDCKNIKIFQIDENSEMKILYTCSFISCFVRTIIVMVPEKIKIKVI